MTRAGQRDVDTDALNSWAITLGCMPHGDGVPQNRPTGLMTPTACRMRWVDCVLRIPNDGGGSSATERHGGGNVLCLARIGSVDRACSRRVRTVDLGRDFGRTCRDRGRRRCGQHHRPAACPLGQFPRRLRCYPADFPGRGRDRPAGGPQAFLVQHEYRCRQLLRAVSGVLFFAHYAVGLALAAGADRWDIVIHDLGRRGLRRDGGNRLQSDRTRQNHPCGLLRDRPRDGPRPRAGVCQLQRMARALCRRHRGRTVPDTENCTADCSPHWASG